VKRQGYTNVFVLEKAAWSETKSGTLKVSPYVGDHKIAVDGVKMDNDLRPGNENMVNLPVEFSTIDDALAELGILQLNYLSVTVNGAEHEVLKGAKQTILRSNNLRVYSKGHAQSANGKPINIEIKEFLDSIGLNAIITKGEPSSTTDSRWLWRSGDVYAWKKESETA
ncbi:MAG: hypothetical protein WBC71_15680, partial [Salaquimonas sp.]